MTDTVLATLRAFVAPRPLVERCELCSAPLAKEHEHVFDPKETRLRCACGPCALLFSGTSGDRPRRVESFAKRLVGFELDDAIWQKLGVPVGLAFFSLRGATREVVASLPGRAGVVETVVPSALWEALGQSDPDIAAVRPDVEALLVRRTPGRRDYFHTSIDHCFRLAGLLRSEPGPMSGPEPALVDRFFADLDANGSLQ
jgi:hypothetical protein